MRALETKFRRLETLEFARFLKPEVVKKLSASVDSNLGNYHLSTMLETLRALNAFYNVQSIKSEFQRSFSKPVVA